jgi:hypothetical protein
LLSALGEETFDDGEAKEATRIGADCPEAAGCGCDAERRGGREDSNYHWPHNSLGYVTPPEFVGPLSCFHSRFGYASACAPAAQRRLPKHYLHSTWYRKSKQVNPKDTLNDITPTTSLAKNPTYSTGPVLFLSRTLRVDPKTKAALKRRRATSAIITMNKSRPDHHLGRSQEACLSDLSQS